MSSDRLKQTFIGKGGRGVPVRLPPLFPLKNSSFEEIAHYSLFIIHYSILLSRRLSPQKARVFYISGLKVQVNGYLSLTPEYIPSEAKCQRCVAYFAYLANRKGNLSYF